MIVAWLESESVVCEAAVEITWYSQQMYKGKMLFEWCSSYQKLSQTLKTLGVLLSSYMCLINLSIGLGTGDDEPPAPWSHGFLDRKVQKRKSRLRTRRPVSMARSGFPCCNPNWYFCSISNSLSWAQIVENSNPKVGFFLTVLSSIIKAKWKTLILEIGIARAGET